MRTLGVGSERLSREYLQTGVPFIVFLAICMASFALLLSQFLAADLVFGILALIVACIVVLARWPYGAFLVLCIASVMPRVKVEIGGWNARPEHYAAFLVAIVFLIRLFSHRCSRIVWKSPDYWLVAYLVWNYVSSVFMSPDPKMTLRWALLNNLAIFPYFLIEFLANDERSLRWAFKAFLGVGVFECAYALMSYASHYVFGTAFGVEVGQYAAGFAGVYGTQYEPNLLGSYSACLGIMLLVQVFLEHRKNTWVAVGTMIALTGLVISLSRAAFLSFVFAAVILLFIGVRKQLVSPKKLLVLTLVVALFTAPVVATGGKNLVARFANLSGDEVQGDVETMGRLISWVVAFEDISRHPVVGNGTASFQLLADAKEAPMLAEHAWISNSIIRVVHDTGIIGLLFFIGFIFSSGKRIKRAIVEASPEKNMIIALMAGCLVYAVAFMSAEGTMLSFFWVHLGLLSAACSVALGDVSQPQTTDRFERELLPEPGA
jgi:hypothetical protein